MNTDRDLSHEKWGEWLELSPYGELSDSEQQALDSHLEQCDRCQAHLVRLRQFKLIIDKAAPSRPVETDVRDARSNLWSAMINKHSEPGHLKGWRDRYLNGLKRLTFNIYPSYRSVLGGALLLFIGLVVGSFIAVQGDRSLGFTASEMEQTELLSNRDVDISNIQFVDSDVSDGTLEFRFEAVTTVQIRGSIDDPGIRRVLAFTVLNEQNPGVRLRAVNAVRASDRLQSEDQIRSALVTALKFDSNPGVRKEVFEALSMYPFDNEIKDAMIHTLIFDENPALRIGAINKLQGESLDTIDENLENVLRDRMDTDENAYIRTRAKTLLTNLTTREGR